MLEAPYVNKGMARFICRIKKALIKNKLYPIDENIILSIYRYYNLRLEPGDKIRFFCKPRKIENFNNPGAFNYKAFMKRKGIICKAYVNDARYVIFMGKEKLPFPYNITEYLKKPVRDFFKKQLDKQDFALFSAIVLGERKNLERSVKEMINKSGLGHILAVSGLHIGLVAWLSFFLIRGILLRSYRLTLTLDVKKASAILTFIPVIGYCLISGLRIPTQRAMIMIFVFLLSIIMEKQDDILSSLCLAGIIILSIYPLSIFSASFQLSFIAVAGIIWLMPHIRSSVLRLIRPANKLIMNRILFYFLDLMAVTISALIILLPLILYYFHRIPLLSIPANMTTVPILGLWILPTSLISISLLPFSYKLASLFLHLSAEGMHWMLSIIKLWAKIPHSSIWLFQPNVLEIMIYYIGLTLIIKRRSRSSRLGIIAISFVIVLDIIFWTNKVKFNKNLRITFLDVGRGSCALIEFPFGKKMLIDGGGFPLGFNEARMVVAPFLWYSRILKIDYILLIHPRGRHMYDLNFITKTFGGKEFRKVNQNINGVIVRSSNNKNILLKIYYKGVTILFAKNIRKYKGKSGKTILVLLPYKVNVSEYDKIPENVPNICIILGAKEKKSNIFYLRFKEMGSKVYTTYKDGAIQIEVKERDKIKIKTWRSSCGKI